MSPVSNVENTAPSTSMRSNAPNVKTLSSTGRSKTIPLALETLWTSPVRQPRAKGPDNFFATAGNSLDSPPTSPDRARLFDQDGRSAISSTTVSSSCRLTAPFLHQQQYLQDSPSDSSPSYDSPLADSSDLQERQGRSTVRLHDQRARRDLHRTGMEYAETGNSPPPFMSPVASPLQQPSKPHDDDIGTKPDLDLLADNEERAKYRSWREGRVRLGAGGPAGSMRSRSGDNSRVEKKIEATLPKAEQLTARSRKASHYLGLFKENDAAEEQKRRGERAKEGMHSQSQDAKILANTHTELVQFPVDEDTAAEQAHSDSGRRISEAQFTLNQHSGLKNPLQGSKTSTQEYENLRPREEAGREQKFDADHRRGLPLNLLEEIRNHHNLAPGGSRGSPFSKSLVTPASVKSKAASLLNQTSEYFPAQREGSEEHSVASEDDDSEHEQISSALYFPHRQTFTAQAPAEENLRSEDLEGTDGRNALGRPSPGKGSGGWNLEEAVNAQEVEISLQSQDENQCLHGDFPAPSTVPEDSSPKQLTSPSEVTTPAGSDIESLAESSSVPDFESSATEEFSTTPTATSHKHAKKKSTVPSQPLAPLGAVELKPYDHQVGGHTTVYRFSRRAVCKQLNNRENEFYETVEHQHPELLDYMPRYIGVLNVTYRKAPRRKKTGRDARKDQFTVPSSVPQSSSQSKTGSEVVLATEADGQNNSKSKEDEIPRVVSHSQQNMPVPQVIFENNRHIIPDNLFRVPPRSATPDPWTRNSSLPPQFHRRNQSDIGLPSSAEKSPSRPPIQQHSSWGVTTINTQLQEEVLRQVFAPPPIHHRGRHGHHHHSIPSRKLRPETHSTVGSAPPGRRSSAADVDWSFHEESTRKQVLKAEAERHFPGDHAETSDIRSPENLPQHFNSDSEATSGVSNGSVKSPASPSIIPRRRHSGGGLRRRPCDVESSRRSNLEFYDEEGYGGDGEEELFAMDDEAKTPSQQTNGVYDHASNHLLRKTQSAEMGMMLPAPVMSPTERKTSPSQAQEPVNPEQAQQQPDERVQHFLLLEDLTAGMSKPCVLDLKMGTRQYGIDADEKKQRSQRNKCKNTTSRDLGVRVCGMQIWNVKTQSYVFEDKYFGRDLRAGEQFQDALKRFFFDGYGYSSAIQHIPMILEKISLLEGMIRKLPRYRFYASSLLMLYDRGDASKDNENESAKASIGDNKHVGESTSASVESQNSASTKRSEMKLKIVDFANCVTAEDEHVQSHPCPPRDPDGVDRGYLRGLWSLRMYFQRIWRDISDQEQIEQEDDKDMAPVDRGLTQESAGKGWEGVRSLVEDDGNVSV